MEKPSFLQRLFESVSRRTGGVSRLALRRALKTASSFHALLSERGEVSGARLARDALTSYQSLDEDSAAAFFNLLADEFSPDPELVVKLAEAFRNDPSQANLVKLQHAVQSPRETLFQRLNMAPGGIGQLLEMRKRVLHELKTKPQWAGIEADLAHLLAAWFNRGFLALQRIDWRTSALVLEKLIQYEAVHQIKGWQDLRRRLQADRRCYAFFHPTLPDEPIIFIEVALTRGMSARVQLLLDPDSPVFDPLSANCAIFYSITNCQEGLRGVSFGNLLIKQVAEDLGREFPRLKTFATLSPIPGFRKWLTGAPALLEGRPEKEELEQLLASLDSPKWTEDKEASQLLQRELIRLCCHYLLHVKHGNEPADSVARFHLGNGARLERLNWLGDTAEAGMSRSAGLMANYVYRLADLERNHEAYASEHKVIASRRFEVLARESLMSRHRSSGKKTAEHA